MTPEPTPGEDALSTSHMGDLYLQAILGGNRREAYADAPTLNGKKVLVACVEGELHEFPSRLVADSLDLAGFEVRYLGASVPLAGLVAMLATEKPDLLALSVTMTFNVPALREAVRSVRARYPGLPIAVGGGACSCDAGLGAELEADAVGQSALEFVEKAKRLLGVAP